MGCNNSDLNDYHHPTNLGRVYPDSDSQFKRTGISPGQISRILIQSNKQKDFNSLSDDELIEIFQISGQNVDKYFHLLQEKISEMYMDLSINTLQNMNNKRFIGNQSKVYITENILSANLRILKVIGRHNDHDYNVQNFRKLNKIQKGLIGYLKSKYPRSAQSFVPGDLMNVFKQFSMVEHPKNDILKNANIYFGEPNHKGIARTVKIFINKIIEQLDTKFPEFQKLLQQQVFVLKKQQGEKTAKTMNYKIGRKIPQNVDKYTDLNRDIFEIRDPEIFRVIIKWVSDMQDFILNPQDQIQEKETFKTVQEEQQRLIFDDINVVQIGGAKVQLTSKLQQQKQSYEQQVKGLIKEMDYFNSNLLKILGQAEQIQKFVPKKEAEVIKYAMFNTKLLSWMVAQKLMLVIKRLIKVGRSFKHSDHMLVFDLIKFNVTDLMRAMVTGTKKQIFEVFQNMKRLEQEDKLSIIKVKNRLASPMNDAMIIFKIKGSFIICQLQLILSDKNQGINEKLKNIETLNHFFYELERSPYGVQSELAIVLGFKDSKIKYENKITYQDSKIDFTLCMKDHPNQITSIQSQTKPFICSSCTKFYDPIQNLFITKNCKKCNTYLCSTCFFRQFPSEQMKVFMAETKALIRQTVQGSVAGKQKTSKQFLNLASNALTQNADYTNLIKIKNIAKKSSGTIKTYKIVASIMQKDLYETYLNYFFYVQFRPGMKRINFLKLNMQTNILQGVFKIPLDIAAQPEIKFEQYDCIILLKRNEYQQGVISQQDLIFSPFKRDLKKEEFLNLNYYKTGKYFIVLDGLLKKKKNQFIQNAQDYQLNKKKMFKLQSIQAARKKLPNVKASKQVYDLCDQGIDDTLLKYFQRVNWKNEIKQINIAKNKITSIQPIVQNIINLQLLYASQNFISEIDFVKPHQSLRVLNVSQNKIKNIKNWNNLVRVQRLQLQSNSLQSIIPLKLKRLKILNLSYNNISSKSVLQQWELPELSQLKLLTSFYLIYQQLEQLILNFPKLKLFSAEYFKVKKIVLNSKCLQKIHCTDCQIEVFQILKLSKLQSINLSVNKIASLDFLSKEQSLDELIQINMAQNAIKEFPNFKAENLKKIMFSNNQIENISGLQTSNFPNLEQLDLQSNLFSSMVVIPSKKIKILNLNSAKITDISCLQNQEYPCLESIHLENIQTFKSFVKLNAVNISQISLSNTAIERLTSEQFNSFKKLTQLKIQIPSLIQMGFLDLSELNTLELSYSKIENIDFLGKSRLPKIQNLNIRYSYFRQELPQQQKIRILPQMDFPALKSLDISYSHFINIKALYSCKFPFLETLNIAGNKFKQMPAIKFQSLKSLHMNDCQIETLQQFSHSEIPQIDFINISSNKLKQFPVLNAPNLTSFQFNNNEQLQLSQKFAQSKFDSLKTLTVYNQNVSKFPKLNMMSLDCLYISYCKILSIENLFLSNLPKITNIQIYQLTDPKDLKPFSFLMLKSLTFIRSELTDISFLCESNLPQLSDINLQGNKIVTIPKASFPKLKSVYISSNLIQDFSNIAQWGQLIESLYLYENKIKKIPRIKMPRLQTLKIENNLLQDISQLNNCQLPMLANLQLDNNATLKILPQLKNLSVQSLRIAYCSLQSIKQLKGASRISQLTIQNNQIGEVPCLENIQLRHITISNCKIADIKQFCSGNYPLLQTIDFPTNQIQKVYRLNCPLLENIDFSQNKITDIIQLAKSNLPLLGSINFNKNKISKLDRLPFENLQSIAFDENQIQSIDQFFGAQYKQLQSLSLRANLIKKVKAKFFAQKLETIQLSENQIQSTGDVSFLDGHLKNLTTVYLYSNQIKKLTKINLGKMYYISLDRNPIRQISEIFTWKISSSLSLLLSIDLKDRTEDEKMRLCEQIDKLSKLCYLTLYDAQQNYLDTTDIKASIFAQPLQQENIENEQGNKDDQGNNNENGQNEG